jgi:hypothetical protein
VPRSGRDERWRGGEPSLEGEAPPNSRKRVGKSAADSEKPSEEQS